MPSITIRNLSEETIARLKAQAQANNRSLEGELRTLLDEAARRPAGRRNLIAEMQALSQGIRLRHGDTAFPDSDDTIADMRADRLARLKGQG